MIPIFTFIGVKAYYEKFYFRYKDFIFKTKIKNNSHLSWLIFFVIIIFLFLEFFLISFPVHNLDSFHEGQKMSAAYKSLLDNSLWSGSYLTVGVFYEILSSKITWKIFDHTSIGLIVTELYLIFVLKILLILFLTFLSNFKLSDLYKILLLLLTYYFLVFN